MTIRRTLLATLAAAALIAPAAQARPADMHASTAEAAAAKAQTQAQTTQDLRSPDARDAGQHLRGASQLPPAGQPTWPANPAPLTPQAQQPATDNDGSPVPVIPLVAGALLAMITALTARHVARRGGRRARIAA
jgi:hypothetical protein